MKLLSAVLFSFFLSNIFAQNLFNKEITPLLEPALEPFYFGVASGDPQQNTVIIWTKVWNETNQPVRVKWEVASDTSMQNIIATDYVTTNPSSAYTVKILVSGLQPNTTYFYRFQTDSVFSPIGRTKTAPSTQADDLRFAVVSCNNYENGFFNAYRLLANRNDLNAVIHLGDYIYEYGANHNPQNSNVRQHIPEHEIVNLQDYRSRYAQYRLDKDLQEAHRLHPFIAVWDDHEFANDAYTDGAKNHQKEEGEWKDREDIAKQAYFEWIPITDNLEKTVVRKLSYGNLADLFMLDGRTEGRCQQLDIMDTAMGSCDRTMLGKKQSDWLTAGVANSSAQWKIIGNQVMFSELYTRNLSKKHPLNPDAWDGYPAERKEILDSFYLHEVKNIIIITGDIHSSWAFDLVQSPRDRSRYKRRTGKGVIGAEFVVPSISSSSFAERVPRAVANLLGSMIKNRFNPHLRFENVVDHGYTLLDLNATQAKATWYFCKTVKEKTQRFSAKHHWMTNYNANRLVKGK